MQRCGRRLAFPGPAPPAMAARPDRLFKRFALLPALAAVAAVTSQLRIETCILNVSFRTVEHLVDRCLGLRERFGISYMMMGGEAEAFAPVVEQLAGR